ncbi:Uncharacterized protein Rs2_27669 [Raphanus sativus]|nr:Uncharacterized protein Rs2_27669 [Raphanus sativus]
MKEIQPNIKKKKDDQSSTDENLSSTLKRMSQSIHSSAITTSSKSQRINPSRVFADLSNIIPTTPALTSDQHVTTPESIFSPTNRNNSAKSINKLPIRSKSYRPFYEKLGQGSGISGQYSRLSRPTSSLIDIRPTNLFNAFSSTESGEQSQIDVQSRNAFSRIPILDPAAATRISPTTQTQFTYPDAVFSGSNLNKGKNTPKLPLRSKRYSPNSDFSDTSGPSKRSKLYMNRCIRIHPTDQLHTFSSSDTINQIDDHLEVRNELNTNADESHGDDDSTYDPHPINEVDEYFGEQVYDVSSEDSDTDTESACENETLSETMQNSSGNTSSLQITGY